jgi:hypothetical protein
VGKERRRKFVIKKFPVYEAEFPITQPDMPFSDDEIARDRAGVIRERGRVREQEAFLANWAERKARSEMERNQLIGEIVRVSKVPLKFVTNRDGSVVMTARGARENLLLRITSPASPPPSIDDHAVQSDLSGVDIDEKVAIWTERKAQRTHCDVLQTKLVGLERQVAERERSLRDCKLENDEKDIEFESLQAEVEVAMRENEKWAELRAQRAEQAKKDQLLREAIRKKRAQLDRLLVKDKALEDRLAALQRIREALDRDLADMRGRHKPEIRKLAGEVPQADARVEQSARKLENARTQVKEKRQQLRDARTLGSPKRICDLEVTRRKLERRQEKWWMLLKTPKENVNHVEFFSAANASKRRDLGDDLQAREADRVHVLQEINDLDRYSDLLATLITEHLAHWKAGPE